MATFLQKYGPAIVAGLPTIIGGIGGVINGTVTPEKGISLASVGALNTWSALQSGSPKQSYIQTVAPAPAAAAQSDDNSTMLLLGVGLIAAVVLLK